VFEFPLIPQHLPLPASRSPKGGRLEAVSVSVRFGGLRAINEVDLVLERDEILGVIGPNGAGKTTLVNALSGFQKLAAGDVIVEGVNVTAWPPHRLARIGLGRSFQNIRLFKSLTVLENVELGGVGIGLSRRSARARGREILERLHLDEAAERQAAALPYGDERRLGIARALAMKPHFLLLDEPAAGLNEAESDELIGVIGSIRDELGCGVLVIEHDMRLIMNVCDRIQVLDHGETIAIGDPHAIQKDPRVITAYLGTKRGSLARS
jgi:branched-chain amino acid transport system ATP-binding protein